MVRVINADGVLYNDHTHPVLFYEIDAWILENLANEVCQTRDCGKSVHYYIEPSPLPLRAVQRVDTLETCIELQFRASCGKHEHVISLAVPRTIIVALAKHRYLPIKKTRQLVVYL